MRRPKNPDLPRLPFITNTFPPRNLLPRKAFIFARAPAAKGTGGGGKIEKRDVICFQSERALYRRVGKRRAKF